MRNRLTTDRAWRESSFVASSSGAADGAQQPLSRGCGPFISDGERCRRLMDEENRCWQLRFGWSSLAGYQQRYALDPILVAGGLATHYRIAFRHSAQCKPSRGSPPVRQATDAVGGNSGASSFFPRRVKFDYSCGLACAAWAHPASLGAAERRAAAPAVRTSGSGSSSSPPRCAHEARARRSMGN